MGATAAVVTTAASSVNQFTQDQRQAQAAVRQGRYAQGAYNFDASVADQQAVDAITRGNEAAGRQITATRQTVGAQRAAYAAEGLDLNSGSPASVTSSTQQLGALDELTLRNNAAREAWGYQVQATDLRSRGAMAAAAGQADAEAYREQGISTLLTGGADAWQEYNALHVSGPKVPTLDAGGMSDVQKFKRRGV